MKIEGSKIRLQFNYVYKGLKTKGSSQLKGFAIAGADGKYKWADAAIEGDTVILWNSSIPEPVSVRYGWADNPDINLYNGAGLPAFPFRTDNFNE